MNYRKLNSRMRKNTYFLPLIEKNFKTNQPCSYLYQTEYPAERSTPMIPYHPHGKEEKVRPVEIVKLEICLWPLGIHFEAGKKLLFRCQGFPNQSSHSRQSSGIASVSRLASRSEGTEETALKPTSGENHSGQSCESVGWAIILSYPKRSKGAEDPNRICC
jgi:hypothetical protein